MSKKTQDTIQEPNAPRNDFLPFAATATSNVLDQASYQALEARTNGFVSGVAKSIQLNKVWRQSSIMSASLAQYINNRTGQDVVDDGDIHKLASLIEMAVKKTSGLGVPMGGIIAWSGAAAAIPQGFSLCDGNNGTPNLVGRFIFGGAEKGAAGGSAKISIEQMPSHGHAGDAANGGAHSHTGSAADAGTHTHTGGSSPAGGHGHGLSDGGHEHTTGFWRGIGSSGGRAWCSEGGNINVPNGKTGIGIQGVGDHTHAMALDNAGNHSHAVNINNGGDHSHTLTINNTGGGQDYLPPFFQLCYIMRTSED